MVEGARREERFRLGMLALALTAALGGCARYTGLPLPEHAALAPDVAALRHDGPLPAALGVEDVARLVLLNDPVLLAARRQHGVAEAQLLQAGLLPNPQASLSATPTLAGPGTTTAWNAGITQDLRSLILRPAAERAAHASVHQVDAQILWQEWQTTGEARLLAVQLIEERRQLALLDGFRALLAGRVADRRRALAAGEATYATLAPDLAALASTLSQIDTLGRLMLQQRHALCALLGLSPGAALPLDDSTGVVLPPDDVLRGALTDFGQRRPDLLALRWGYENANETLRGAILKQYPNIAFGLTGGSDNSNVRAMGPQLTLELPIFDHGQGAIAAARATRRQLHDEYVARLAAAEGEVCARLDELDQLAAQIASLKAQLPDIRHAAEAASAPDTAALIDPQARVDLLGARFTREAELVTLDQARLEQGVALETLLGVGAPSEGRFRAAAPPPAPPRPADQPP